MGITLSDCSFEDEGSENKVNISFNDSVKSAECECGNSWEPKTATDYKCHKCSDEVTL